MINDSLFSTEMQMHKGYRYQHDCPSNPNKDRCLVITRIEAGWKYYCHRCGEKGVKSTRSFSPEEYKRWVSTSGRAIPENSAVAKVTLPQGFTTDIPAPGLAWLYKYDLSDQDISFFNIGYTPRLNRVILPVYRDDGKLIYWQGRNLGTVTEQSPKYCNVRAVRTDVWMDLTSDDISPEGDRVVLVEDILSAIRVSKTEPTIGLLFAYIPDPLVLSLAKEYEQIILWLDPDKQNRMVKRVNRYRAFGINVVMIRASQDPKFYSAKEINQKLMEV
ncbi:MAG: hypothetical protein ACYS32_00470 [Planctomycetota bacterium]|jgi:hypothetical protein